MIDILLSRALVLSGCGGNWVVVVLLIPLGQVSEGDARQLLLPTLAIGLWCALGIGVTSCYLTSATGQIHQEVWAEVLMEHGSASLCPWAVKTLNWCLKQVMANILKLDPDKTEALLVDLIWFQVVIFHSFWMDFHSLWRLMLAAWRFFWIQQSSWMSR